MIMVGEFEMIKIMHRIDKLIEKYRRSMRPIEYWRSKGAKIGENCYLFPSASLGSEPYLIKIGNHVRINAGVQFVTHDGGMWVLRQYIRGGESYDLFGEIVIGDNVHIGTNTIIMPRVHIGSNVVIGCGAIVTHDIPDNSVACGVPARVIETVDEYYHKNMNNIDNTKLMPDDEKRIYLMKKYG